MTMDCCIVRNSEKTHISQPPAVDMLAAAIEHVRPHLDRSLPIGRRARVLWAAVAAGRSLGAVDVVEREFVRLADESGLTCDLTGGAKTIDHIIRSALLDQIPFAENGNWP
jgi:hypothetical protein